MLDSSVYIPNNTVQILAIWRIVCSRHHIITIIIFLFNRPTMAPVPTVSCSIKWMPPNCRVIIKTIQAIESLAIERWACHHIWARHRSLHHHWANRLEFSALTHHWDVKWAINRHYRWQVVHFSIIFESIIFCPSLLFTHFQLLAKIWSCSIRHDICGMKSIITNQKTCFLDKETLS